MATEQRLEFEIVEPDQPPIFFQVFSILREILQPNSSGIENAVQRIIQLLPEGRPYSNEVDTFLTTCYSVAEQIPYAHPSMMKLVTIIESCLKSSHFDGKERKLGHVDRFQKLGETMREWWDSTGASGDEDETPEKYVNFHTFAARILEKGLIRGQVLAILSIRDAMKFTEKRKDDIASAYAKAMSQWLLICGAAMYENRKKEKLEESEWARWHERLRAVASGDANTEAFEYDQEAVELAGKAVAAMKAIEAADRQTSGERKTDAGEGKTSAEEEEISIEDRTVDQKGKSSNNKKAKSGDEAKGDA